MKDDPKKQLHLHPWEEALARDAKKQRERAELDDAYKRAFIRESEERQREREIERQRAESGQVGTSGGPEGLLPEAGSAKKPNPPVAPSPSLALLGRIIARQSISFEKWVKGHRDISKTQFWAWKAAGGRPVKGTLKPIRAR